MNEFNERKSENMQSLKAEVNRSWYEDGMVEVGMGFVYLLLGLALFLYNPKPFSPLRAGIFVFTVCAIIFVGAIWVPRKLKRKLVWSEVGYSVVKEPYPKAYWIFLGLSLLSAVFAFFSMKFFSSALTIFSFGCVLFFALVGEFFQVGRIKRFLYLSFVPLFAAGIGVLLGLSWKHGMSFMVFAIGCFSLVCGIVVYRGFRGKLDS